MSGFVYHGPLAPDSALFRGRASELARLKQLCQGDVHAYAIVYGGRQNGKTSLLLRLAASLPEPIRTCRVDFQGLPGATTSQVYGYLAQHVADNVQSSAAVTQVKDAPDLIEFLCKVVSRPEIGRLVLMLEELGALPRTSREDLANVLRSIFTSRYDSTCRPLAKLVVVLAGSVELYDLAATQVSTLHNICEAIYLLDLSEDDAIDLVADGLNELGLPRAEAEMIGRSVYVHVGGHPYFTQRLGGILVSSLTAGTLNQTDVARGADLLLSDDPLLHHLRKALSEQQLVSACRTLLNGRSRFSRLDEEMARLELMGLAREANGYWVVRDKLLERMLGDWVQVMPVSSVRQPQTLRERPIAELIEMGERNALEFKSTLQWDVKLNQLNKGLRFSVLKTIAAFLNSDGGTLVIGVEDDGTIFGLSRDLATLTRKSLDGFQQHLISLIGEYIGLQFAGLIRVRFGKLKEEDVCAVEVDKALEPAFMKGQHGKEFYVRFGNTTRALDLEQTHHYIQMNW